MIPPPPRARAASILLLAALAASCGSGPDDDSSVPSTSTPPGAALALFALADDDDRSGLRDVLSDDLVGDDPERAEDALDGLRGIVELRVVAAEALEVTGRWAVDLEGARTGPTLVSCSVQVEPCGDACWRVVWFACPDVEWPSSPRSGPGLATSPPPAGSSP